MFKAPRFYRTKLAEKNEIEFAGYAVSLLRHTRCASSSVACSYLITTRHPTQWLIKVARCKWTEL